MEISQLREFLRDVSYEDLVAAETDMSVAVTEIQARIENPSTHTSPDTLRVYLARERCALRGTCQRRLLVRAVLKEQRARRAHQAVFDSRGKLQSVADFLDRGEIDRARAVVGDALQILAAVLAPR